MKNEKTQHTPAPWIMSVQPNSDIRIFSNEHQIWIAELHYEDNKTVDVSIWKEFEANARLIASAPELLGALKQLHETTRKINPQCWDAHTPNALVYAEKLIAKAEGKNLVVS